MAEIPRVPSGVKSEAIFTRANPPPIPPPHPSVADRFISFVKDTPILTQRSRSHVISSFDFSRFTQPQVSLEDQLLREWQSLEAIRETTARILKSPSSRLAKEMAVETLKRHVQQTTDLISSCFTAGMSSDNRELASLAHDLRSPLTVFSGYIELISVSSDFEKLAEVIKAPKSIEQIIQENCLKQQKHYTNAEIHFQADTEIKKVECAEINSRFKFRRIVSNLATNALKYQPTIEGHLPKIDVRVGTQGRNLVMIVEDNGLGMNEKFLKEKFGLFNSRSADVQKSYQGTGAGMAGTLKQLEDLGGELRVSSKQGVGSTFAIKIPLASLNLSTPEGHGLPIVPNQAINLKGLRNPGIIQERRFQMRRNNLVLHDFSVWDTQHSPLSVRAEAWANFKGGIPFAAATYFIPDSIKNLISPEAFGLLNLGFTAGTQALSKIGPTSLLTRGGFLSMTAPMIAAGYALDWVGQKTEIDGLKAGHFGNNLLSGALGTFLYRGAGAILLGPEILLAAGVVMTAYTTYTQIKTLTDRYLH